MSVLERVGTVPDLVEVAQAIAIRVPVKRIGASQSLVGIREAIAVVVFVARVAGSVAIRVRLAGIRHRGAVVGVVANAVPVAIRPLGGVEREGVGAIGMGICVCIGGERIRAEPCLLRIRQPIAVVVGIAGVAGAVAVRVDLVAVRDERAVVVAGDETVAIRVRVTGVACAVPVSIDLVRVGDGGAVVGSVAVPVAVRYRSGGDPCRARPPPRLSARRRRRPRHTHCPRRRRRCPSGRR